MERNEVPKFNELKVLLLRNDHTYEDLAKCIGSSKPTIVRKVTGKTPWTWVDMQRIRTYYNLTNEQFMNIFFERQVAEV